MRFTPLEDIICKPEWGMTLEAGIPITSEKRGIPDADVEIWYEAGLIEIEGRETKPRKQCGPVKLEPQNGTILQEAK
jgi:hypothetical protein